MLSIPSRAVFVAAMFCLLPLPGAGIVRSSIAMDAVAPRELVEDPATLRCLAFRWLIEGDENTNAAVTVTYRKTGETAWQEALPLLRVHHEVADREGKPFRGGNLFAGSILGLEEGTPYEVRLRLSDPDGGSAEKTLSCRTRSTPAVWKGDRTVHIYPEGFAGTRQSPGFADLRTACRQARAGDVVLIHAGVYRGLFGLSGDGTAKKPIVFRAAGDGPAILDGGDAQDNIVDVQGRKHVALEGLTIRNGRIAVKANAAVGLVIRSCTIENVGSGVVSFSTESSGWYIADNTITGRVKSWYPRVDSGETGISCAGSGNVVCYNRVSRFWDCISTDNVGSPKPEWADALQPPQVSIDIYGNDCSEALDDAIEADTTLHNIRVFENRILNAHVGLSAQPCLSGPLYIFRNAIYNTTYAPFKLHNFPTGLIIVNNTSVCARQAFESWPPAWRNATLWNNVFLGNGRATFENGSPDPRTKLDYNGYGRPRDPERLVIWSADEGKSRQRFSSLAAFAKATGHEAHGREIDYSDLVKALPPVEGRTYSAADFDLRPAPGSAIAVSGREVPTITASRMGSPPSIGCYAAGAALPHYGPRSARTAAVGRVGTARQD